jgi:hypothetical protein
MRIFILITIMALNTVLSSCDIQTNEEISIGKPSQNIEIGSIDYPVKVQYITRKEMNYMIASGTNSNSGTSICNLTLDSLQLEYYKKLIQ